MQWRDNQGRPWTCRLTIADVKRLKANGCDIADAKAFQSLFADSLAVVEIISEAMRPQWESAGVSYEQFAEIITEDVGRLLQVQEAFAAGLADFFRRLGDNAMAIVVEKAQAAAAKSRASRIARASSERVDKMITQALAKEESDFQKQLDAEEAKLSGKTLTSEPEFLASTLDHGPIAN